MDSSSDIGPLLRLWGIRHDKLPLATASGEELAPFLTAILREAVPFIDSAAPKSGGNSGSSAEDGEKEEPERRKKKQNKLWKSKGTRTHADSTAPVAVSERRVSATALRRVLDAHPDDKNDNGDSSSTMIASPRTLAATSAAEFWCCRRSVHADAARPGTAAWREFDACHRRDHAACEAAFTPNVREAREALRWDCAGVRVAAEKTGKGHPGARRGGSGGGNAADAVTYWGDFHLAVMEMRHRVGTGLRDRTFPVLQMSCVALAGGGQNEGEGQGGGSDEAAAAAAAASTTTTVLPEFLFISIPVPDFGSAPQSKLAAEPDALIAVYASVERIRKLPPRGGGEGEGEGEIEWLMATASDARGALPAWLQNIAMPAVIWKDVPLFLGWLARERGKQGGSGSPDAAAAAAAGGREGEGVAAGSRSAEGGNWL